MKRVLTAVILIPLVLLLVFRGPFWLMAVVSALISLLAAWEFLSLADLCGARTPRFSVQGAILLLHFVSFWKPLQAGSALSLLSLALFLLSVFRSPNDRVLPDAASSIFCLIYVGFTMTTFPLLLARENGPSLLAFLLCVVWAGDSCALYVGGSYGRRRIAPSLSPNKTLEGTIASLVGGLLITGFLVALSGFLAGHDITLLNFPEPLWYWLLLAVVLNAGAQLGDLAESALKRGAGVKDAGNILPGHGGVLDRMDALLIAAPLLWYAQLLLQF
jgi:phosphatidate cytidylyltransferase